METTPLSIVATNFGEVALDATSTSLSPATAALFEREQLISPVAGNKRRLFRGVLAYMGGSFLAPDERVSRVCAAPDAFLDVPHVLFSAETLEFLGFTPAKAREIFAVLLTGVEQPGSPLADLLAMTVASLIFDPGPGARRAGADPRAYWFARAGVGEALQRSALAADAARPVTVDAAKAWVKDSTGIRWSLLEWLERDLRFQAEMMGQPLDGQA